MRASDLLPTRTTHLQAFGGFKVGQQQRWVSHGRVAGARGLGWFTLTGKPAWKSPRVHVHTEAGAIRQEMWVISWTQPKLTPSVYGTATEHRAKVMQTSLSALGVTWGRVFFFQMLF